MKVVIDGVEYIPAKSALVNRQDILRTLLETYWGDLDEAMTLDAQAKNLWVQVYDDGEGTPLLEFMDLLAKRAGVPA